MDESNRKALASVVRVALKSSVFGLLLLGTTPLRAEPTRLSWLVGSGSDSDSQDSYLWNRVEIRQWFVHERFFLDLDFQSRSLLSDSRDWGGALGAGVAFSLGSSFEWLPSLRLENDISTKTWESVVQNTARYQIWALLLDTSVAYAPRARDGRHGFALRQSIGLSLGEGNAREDFVSLDVEFKDSVSASSTHAQGPQLRRVGIAFASQVEF
ncbi:MAG: hypothetical protein ABIR96_06045 [Bdellovibrionota bacterium]